MHAERHFVLGDACGDPGIGDVGELDFVQLVDFVNCFFAVRECDAGGVGEEEDGVAFGAELNALIDGGEEAGTPHGVACAGDEAGVHNDECGEVLVEGAEAVGGPCADGGTTVATETGLCHELCGGVVELFGVEGVDDAEFIGDGGEVWEEGGELEAGGAVFFELPEWGHEVGLLADEGKAEAFPEVVGHLFAIVFVEVWAVVEEVEL